MATVTELVGETPSDPDAQAVITDFLDFTEYFPSDLLRSLTLIRGLDETYQTNSYAVHELTKVYGSLPTYNPSSRPNAETLRSQISTHLDRALNVRESSHAEADRLLDAADRHYNRLQSIIAKLNALPKPPSRDPTPQPTKSPQAKRSRSGRKIENGTSIQRLTLNPPRGSIVASAILHRPRHRRVTVPGEVLPPFDPDSPIASTEVSDWDDDPPTPIRPVLKLKTNPPKEKEVIKKVREPREPAASYRKPTPPPEDAEIGSKFKPWTRLTEWEMYKLRKKMKKNHNWEPSEVMIRRELSERGRGWDNYYRARAEAQAKGKKLLDCDNLDKGPAGKAAETPTATSAMFDKKDPKKGEPKKQKSDPAALSQAQRAAQEAELAARRLGDIGSAFKNLFSPLSSALASLHRSGSSTTTNTTGTGKKTVDKSQRKRKLDEMEISASPTAEDPKTKKQKSLPKPSPLPASKTATPVPQTTIKISLKPPASEQPAETAIVSTPQPASRASSTRRASVAPKLESTPPVMSRPPSRRSTIEPPSSITAPTVMLRGARRTSTPVSRKTPIQEGTPKNANISASRRSKREAPGTVTQSSQDGGAAVSVSNRKTKPGKKAVAPITHKVADVPTPEIRIDVDGNKEVVDPDEERYCICGDVSWGEMICCEMDEKCDFGMWFHMDCVQLPEMPPRTVKWYCPGDRKKYHKGENSNGLVGRGIK